VSGYPTPDELLAAHRTMRKMTAAAMAEATGPNDMPDPAAFLRGAWADWVEATRQIAVACSWMGDDEGGTYAEAWDRMMDDD
jgi:hypothetical protein